MVVLEVIPSRLFVSELACVLCIANAGSLLATYIVRSVVTHEGALLDEVLVWVGRLGGVF